MWYPQKRNLPAELKRFWRNILIWFMRKMASLADMPMPISSWCGRLPSGEQSFLAPAFQKKGLGKAFYRALMDILRLQNVEKVYGCIEATNRASYVLHTSLGFVETAVFPRCGFKHGKWLGLMWLEKPMVERREPLPFQKVWDVDEKKIAEILENRSKEVRS